jgi:hypothetical protein
MSDRLPRVQIVNRKHPHFEEYGRLTGKIITMRFGDEMAEVRLENCRHGADGCFVSRGDVIQVAGPMTDPIPDTGSASEARDE